MKRFVLPILLVMTPFLTQCGGELNQSQQSSISEQKVPIIVVMGGNTSCGRDAQENDPSPYAMGMYSRVRTLIDTLRDRAGVSSQYIVSCYGESSTVVYSTSSEPDKISQVNREEFTQLIEATHRRTEQFLYLAGHSYGGWLGMKVAADLGEQIEGLFTIDPISRVKCSFNKPFGCQSSPTDIPSDQRRTIQQGTEHWANFYQKQTWYLHASSIAEADKNYKISAAHTEIDTKADVWNEIYKVVSSRY